MKTLVKNATIVNEGKQMVGFVIVENERFTAVQEGNYSGSEAEFNQVVDATGMLLIPGLIDDQVHFREPGLTHKAELATESKAAVAGGITSFMEMPNTVPNTLTQELLEEKYQRAAQVSPANYSFFMGASNDNLEEVLKTDPKTVCGVKVFMGSSTGNMLVDKKEVLENLFANCKMLIATHCEDEDTIRRKSAEYKERYGDDVPMECHPEIRDEEACYLSSSFAVELAKKHNTRLHILHISTAKEVNLFESNKPLSEKRITAEACVHHLWFTNEQYATKGSHIKWNPAVKYASDRAGVRAGVVNGNIDVLATDHAPHTLEEKAKNYWNAPSGGPLVQHALPALLELVKQGVFTLELVVQKACHNVAILFEIQDRGFIKPGYFADFVLVDPNSPWTVEKSNLLYKCGWSPFEGETFSSKIVATYVNGALAYNNFAKADLGKVTTELTGKRLLFNR